MRALGAAVALSMAIVAAFSASRHTVSAQDPHARDAEPDYRRVFAQDVVNRLDIRMAPDDWQTVLTDMQSMAGPSGFGLNVGFSTEQIAACSGRLEANACTA